MPGFVAGYWVAFSRDKGTAMVMFESEEAARALADMVHDTNAVTAGGVEMGGVMGHASCGMLGPAQPRQWLTRIV